MKRIITTLIFLLLINNNAFSWTQEEAREEIKNTQRTLIILDNNLDLRPYIPYDIYSDGLTELLNARTEFENENYSKALYLAVMSMIKLETVAILAEARSYRDKIIIIERDYYKKFGNKGGDKSVGEIKDLVAPQKSIEENKGFLGSIVDANLLKKGNSYRIILLDTKLFRKDKFILTEKGMESLKKIVAVLNADPGTSVKVAGHTSSKDYKEYSKYKAGVVSKFLNKNGIDPSRITTYGIGNSEVMDTPWGFRHLDSVEIIISIGKQAGNE